MPRPKTKTELLTAAQTQYEKMLALIDSMSEADQVAPFSYDAETAGKEAHWQRDKNLRDVLVHLNEWHQMLLVWVAANQGGTSQPFLPEPYNWRTYGELNIVFWQKNQATEYTAAREMLQANHAAIMAMIESFSDEDLFTKGRLTWIGGSTLGSYCISTTSSHYDWAIKKIKLQIKALKQDRA